MASFHFRVRVKEERESWPICPDCLREWIFVANEANLMLPGWKWKGKGENRRCTRFLMRFREYYTLIWMFHRGHFVESTRARQTMLCWYHTKAEVRENILVHDPWRTGSFMWTLLRKKPSIFIVCNTELSRYFRSFFSIQYNVMHTNNWLICNILTSSLLPMSEA